MTLTAAFTRRPRRALLALLAGATMLAGCQVSDLADGAHLAPVPGPLVAKIDRLNMDKRSPILVRIFKEESELEVWKRDRGGRFALLKTYEICAWSGELGPKLKEGDRQAPEGFYTVGPGQMNPNSSYHLSFNIGFPNRFDKSHGRTGSHLMVHGDCSSRGCYAMEDDQIEEIYALAREAFRGGQSAFQIQAFPFRMTPKNMARHHDSEHLPFWEMLKKGSDHFEVTRRAPRIDVCDRRYVFNALGDDRFEGRAACPAYQVEPSIAAAVAAKRDGDLRKRQTAIARMELREERQDRWEEREKAIASFFDAARSGQDATAEGAPPAAEAPVVVAEETEPGPSTVSSFADPQAGPQGAIAARFRSIGLPFGRRDGDTISSEAGAALAMPPTQPVASIAGHGAAQTVVAPAPEAAPTAARTPPPPVEVPAPALSEPPQEEKGFLSSVARGGKGLFRAAGSLFD